MMKISFRSGISYNLLPVLIPNFFNGGVDASTTEPGRFVSLTTANFVFKGSKPFSIQDTEAKKAF